MKYYVCYFFIYAFLGWVMEVLYAFYDDKKFVNRGFLIGPYCPIYGYGSVLIIFLLRNSLSDPLSVYLKAVLIAAILEYITSFMMEQLFHARWWDYSDNKFNINGRICLETLIPFGFLACFSVYIINPAIDSKIVLVDSQTLNVILFILCSILLIDTVISFKAIYGMRRAVNQTTEDNTIDIKNQLKERFYERKQKAMERFEKLVKESFSDKSRLKKRIMNAFPNIHVDFERARQRIEKKKAKKDKKK